MLLFIEDKTRERQLSAGQVCRATLGFILALHTSNIVGNQLMQQMALRQVVKQIKENSTSGRSHFIEPVR